MSHFHKIAWFPIVRFPLNRPGNNRENVKKSWSSQNLLDFGMAHFCVSQRRLPVSLYKCSHFKTVLILYVFRLESRQKIAELGKNCTFDAYSTGWQCKDTCIDLSFVCDGFESCNEDTSDEEQGCNLFPETGCNSWKTKKHTKCPHSHKCVLHPDSECTNEASGKNFSTLNISFYLQDYHFYQTIK